jgi:hypothetical protein
MRTSSDIKQASHRSNYTRHAWMLHTTQGHAYQHLAYIEPIPVDSTTYKAGLAVVSPTSSIPCPRGVREMDSRQIKLTATMMAP